VAVLQAAYTKCAVLYSIAGGYIQMSGRSIMTLLCTVIAQFYPIKLDGIDPFRPEEWLYCVAADGR